MNNRDVYGRTSNDLFLRLSNVAGGYETIPQAVEDIVEDILDIQNSPAISMGPFLISSGQTSLLTTISVYSERGTSAEQVRLLYMNPAALSVWRAMGKPTSAIGSQKRPPKTALLAYGVPFSE
jgi:hypothetical protein